MQIRWFALVGVALAAGCEKNSEQTAAAPVEPARIEKMTDAEIIEAGFRVMLDMSQISEANAKDCDRAAEQLGAFVDRHEAMIEAFQRVTAAQATKDEVVAAHEQDIALIRERSIPLQENCRDHERLQAVFARLVQ